MAPEGYEIIDEGPALDTDEQQKALIGKMILHAWDNATGNKWQSSANLLFVFINIIISSITYASYIYRSHMSMQQRHALTHALLLRRRRCRACACVEFPALPWYIVAAPFARAH